MLLCRHAEVGGVVLSAIMGALAAVLKRGWLEAQEEDRRSFFAELEAAVQNTGAPAARRAALQILTVSHPALFPHIFSHNPAGKRHLRRVDRLRTPRHARHVHVSLMTDAKLSEDCFRHRTNAPSA